MEKVYRLLQWLDTRQAVDWLQDMTATPLTERELLQLCGAEQCDLYMSAPGLEGVYFDADGNEKKCIGKGYQKVIGRRFDHPFQHFELEGQYFEHPIDPATWPLYGFWCATTEIEAGYGIYFKPADIQALAAKMNGVADHATDIEGLRQQLEQERAAREAAEAELLRRRAKDGQRALDEIRLMQMHDHKEFVAMQERAEQAERMVASLDRQLTEQAERKRLNDKAFKEMAKQLREHHAGQQPDTKPEAPASGLTFPYATKELETMRATAAKYWADYTPDKRQPTQKEIGLELGELLRLPRQANGDPARKAITLAAAIKPDTLPDA